MKEGICDALFHLEVLVKGKGKADVVFAVGVLVEDDFFDAKVSFWAYAKVDTKKKLAGKIGAGAVEAGEMSVIYMDICTSRTQSQSYERS
jgi:hypothetical protein